MGAQNISAFFYFSLLNRFSQPSTQERQNNCLMGRCQVPTKSMPPPPPPNQWPSIVNTAKEVLTLPQYRRGIFEQEISYAKGRYIIDC